MRIGSQDKAPKEYAEAHERISQATAEMETRAVQMIQVGMADDWKAAAWWLERARPSRWATKRRTRTAPPEEQSTPEEIKNAGAQKQHAELFKKLLLRQHLIKFADPGAAYVPFIGDGDITVEMYADRKIYGADLNPKRVEIAKTRLPNSDIRVFDCNEWPFPDINVDPIAIADLDAYSNPYPAFYAVTRNARLTDRCVIFFTDGQRQTATRVGTYHTPYGEKITGLPLVERRKVNNQYKHRVLMPWITEWCDQNGWKLVKHQAYLRGWMIYWGIVIERKPR